MLLLRRRRVIQINKVERIKELVNICSYHSNLYYNLDKPELNDKEYDKYYDELLNLEQETGYILSSSPTQKVQGEILPYLTKVIHSEPMLSAEKSKDINDVLKFMGNKECVLSWKLDGLTLVLKYNNGQFQQAITRGSGTEGEDVSHTVKTFMNVPMTIPYKGYLEIRGEGLVLLSELEKVNAELILQGELPYSNCRNLASGSVRQLNAKTTKERNMIFIAFGIVKCDLNSIEKYSQLKWLRQLGFEVVYHEVIDKSTLQSWITIFKNLIPNLSFLTDGLIIEYNDIPYGKAHGVTGHHSKALYAMKWNDDNYETTFRGVELNTTRTGMVSLTALFDEVEIDGVRVSRASLHNYDIFEDLELGVGDTVTVYRANAVIPQIEDNLTRSGTYKIEMKCPSCGNISVLKRPKEARFIYCENENCPSKLISKFVHFCSKEAMNIDGFSEAGIQTFVNLGWLKTFVDLYKLEQYKDKIVKLEGFGKKSYENMIAAIEKSKLVELNNFFVALGIPQIGTGGAKRLAKHFNNDMNKFLDAIFSGYDFTKVEDFGQITADALVDYFGNSNNRDMIRALLSYVKIKKVEKKEVVNSDNPFSGKKIYATGTFANYKKEDIQKLLESLGAEFASGYAKSLDYLIVGSVKGSSKEDKAKKDNVKILGELEFMKML